MIFVSDLHMGGGGDDDDFSPNAEDCYLQLVKAYKWHRHFVVGDGCELLQADLDGVRAAHPKVMQLWESRGNIDYVVGNHDLATMFEYSMCGAERIIQRGTANILIIHGHQFDAANKSGNGLGKYVAQVVGFLERYVHKDVDDWLDRLYGIVKKRASEYDQGMADLAKENDCGIVVYGHTHFPAVKNVDGITVANCGCWTHRFENGYPYVKIGCNGVVSLKWWG